MKDILKIFGLVVESDYVSIIGDREALIKLKGIIERAINTGETETILVFESDGEGYQLNIKMLDKLFGNSEVWKKLPMSYYIDRKSISLEQWRYFSEFFKK